jgi:hypothetical protein
MKREQLILQTMSDKQLGHTQNLIDREVKRRSSAPPARSHSKKASTSKKKTSSASARA